MQESFELTSRRTAETFLFKMVETFCFKCFKFSKENSQLDLLVFDCAHVSCVKCLHLEAPNVCVICKAVSLPKKLQEALQNVEDPGASYQKFVHDILFQFTQQNATFNYCFNHLPAEIEQSKLNKKNTVSKCDELNRQNQELEKKIEKYNRYINYIGSRKKSKNQSNLFAKKRKQ